VTAAWEPDDQDIAFLKSKLDELTDALDNEDHKAADQVLSVLVLEFPKFAELFTDALIDHERGIPE
jgi:hypothetical protein